MTKTVFAKIPEWFVIHYNDELCKWGKGIKACNESNIEEGLPPNSHRMVLNEGIFGDVSPDPHMGSVMLQVTLQMRVTRAGWTVNADGMPIQVAIEVEVFPHSERDEALIRRHCEKMVKLGIDPRKRLIEPPRAGIPFLPDRIWSPPKIQEQR